MLDIFSKILNFFKGKKSRAPEIFKSGCIKDTPDERDYKKELKIRLNASPKTFSLRKYIPGGILNQKTTSACSGYAGAYAMSIILNRQLEILNKDKNVKFNHVSPTYIYYNARKSEGFSTKVDEGSTLRSIMKALKNPGSIDISAMPMDYSVVKDPPKAIDELPKYTITSYFRIEKDENTVELMQRILDTEHLPIVCGIIMYQNQTDNAWYNGGILEYDNVSSDRNIGGHAICITGYKYINDKLYFELCNSWGSLWGSNGFGYIPATMVTTDDMMDIWTFDRKYF